MEERLMVTIPVEDYNKLVKDQGRLEAVVNYMSEEKFSPDKNVIYALADRAELIKKED